MIDRQVQLLDHIRFGLGHMDAYIAQRHQAVFTRTGQPNHFESFGPCRHRRIQNILAIAAGGNTNEYIPR